MKRNIFVVAVIFSLTVLFTACKDAKKEEMKIDLTSRENLPTKAYRFPALSLLKKTEKK